MRIPVDIPVQLLLELEPNLLVQNVIELEFELIIYNVDETNHRMEVDINDPNLQLTSSFESAIRKLDSILQG